MRGTLPRLGAVAAACLALAAPAASAGPIEPRSAHSFRESVGVNTHIAYYDTAYGNWPRVVARLEQLGVRHLRDSIYANPSWGDWNERYYRAVERAADHGMRFTFLMGRPRNDGGTLDQLVDVASGRLRHAAEALESPNEFDYFVGGRNWPSVLSAYLRDLHRKTAAVPSLRRLPLLGPSFKTWDGPTRVGDQRAWMDAGNIHPYTGGVSPNPGLLRAELARTRPMSGGKPVWATEAGFHNALRTRDEHPPVSEAAAAVYTLRTVLENFKGGIERTYLYELVDQKADPGARDPEQHFGLLRHDFSPKPAYRALRNLLALVGDAHAGRAAMRPLRLSVSGADSRVRRLVLQRRDGTYVIVLWRLASVWDQERGRPLAVDPDHLTVAVPGGARVAAADPVASSASRPRRVRRGRVQVSLGSHPVALEVTPRGLRR